MRDVCDNIGVCSGVPDQYPQKMSVEVAGVAHVNVTKKMFIVCVRMMCVSVLYIPLCVMTVLLVKYHHL